MYPRVEILDHTVAQFLVSQGNSILLFTVASPIYIPTNSGQGWDLSIHILTNIFDLWFFWIITFLTCVRWYLVVVLICIFLIISSEHFFRCLLAFISILLKNEYSSLLPISFFNLLFICIFSLLYSMVAQLHFHVYILFFHITCSIISD